MATQYTSILKLALPVQGELSGTWGTAVNEQVTSMVEEAIAGLKTINTWSTNSATLSTADGSTSESRAAILNLTDTTSDLSGAATLICPAASKVYIVKNGTGQTVTVKTASGTGIAIPDGLTGFVYCDGTNVLEALTNVAGNMTIGGNLTVTGTLDLTDSNFSNVGSIALDSITNDGTDITLDSSNDIVIDAAGGNIEFKDDGTLQLVIDMDGTAGAQVVKLGVDSDDLIFQQYDGNEVVRIADDRKLYFFDKGGEHISSDGTDFTLASGNDINLTATTDINIPSGVGLTFGNDAEKIEGDGTDLTISGNNINLTATTDVVIPSGVGLVLDGSGNEKIESDGTDISISVGSGGDINVPANIGVTFGNDGEKIEGDGTDLTISGNNINLTATADVNIPSGVGLTFATGEKIESDGTDLSITVGSGGDINVPSSIGVTFGDDGEKIEGDGTDLTIASSNDLNLTATTDINIPANVGLTFGDDAEKIEGDGTDLTIAGNNINLTAVADVVIPANVGVTFGTGEKIEGNNTDLTVTSGADINLTATTDINVPANVGLTFGNDAEKIEGDGTDLTITGNNIKLTASADVVLAVNTGLVLDGSGAEKIESDGTDINFSVGSNGDINIPANIGLTFGDDGEKIEGDGTDLTIAGNNINLNASSAVSVNDANITNVGDIALDSISADGTDINVAVSDNSATAFTVKQGSDAYLIVDTANSSESVAIGTGISGTAITLGHSTSEVTVADNLTVTGDLTVSGTTTTVNSTTVNLNDHNIVLDSGNSTSAVINGAGITIEGGSGSDATFTYNTTGPQFELKLGSSFESLKVDQLIADSLDIEGVIDVNGQTNLDVVDIDGAVDMASTLTVAGVVDITDTTDSSDDSGDTGALRVEGGASIAKKLFVGTDLDVDGTTNLDAVDIDGAVQVDATVTVGVNDTGYDVKFFGATSGQFMLWDESADELVLAGDSKLSFHDAAGGENIIASSNGHLEINAGTTLDITAATTQVNASTLFDVNGDADISGTLLVTGVATHTAKPIFNAGISVKNGATGPGFIEFFEDSDHGTNHVKIQANSSDQSYSGDITLTLPSTTGTVATTASAADEATALAIALG